MCWATNHDVIHYISSSDEDIDATSPITPGESVLLRKAENEFKALVVTSEGNIFKGTVLSIGPIPTLEAQGINRGQTITFGQQNVFRVYRAAGVGQ